VLGTGKGLIHVAGNLSTSRLVSYGFLAQAKELLIDTYQVSDVLDRRICPLCRGQLVPTGTVREVLEVEDEAAPALLSGLTLAKAAVAGASHRRP
jgi:hypothetical protein